MGIQDAKGLALDALVELSNRYGKDPRYVLIGGGNSSWKDGSVMYIKASGRSLATITADGFAGMDRKRLDVVMDKQYDRGDDAKREAAVLDDIMAARLPGCEHLRPSVETPLHNLFPYTFVLHLHPALVNGMTCGQQGREAAHELFGDSFIWIPEIKPGYELSKYCGQIISEYETEHGTPPKIAFIQNHGVFVAADSVEEIDKLYAGIMYELSSRATDMAVGETAEDLTSPPGSYQVQEDLASPPGSYQQVQEDLTSLPGSYQQVQEDLISPPGSYQMAAYGKMPIDLHGKPGEVRLILEAFNKLPSPPANICFINNPDALRFLGSKEQFIPLSGAFTPDHIVYCKPYFLFLDGQDAESCAMALPALYAGYIEKHGYEPRLICARGIGVFCCADTVAEVHSARVLFDDAVKVAIYSANFGGPRHLSAEMVDFIANWEVETYRRKVAE